MTLRLVSLDCPSCGSAMRGEGLDTIFFCGHCGGAAVLDDEQVQTVEATALLAAPGHHAGVWRPAWRLEVQARVHHRVRSDGRVTPDSEGKKTFFIPAFSLSLPDLSRLSRALSNVSEAAREVPKEPIHGGTLSVDDALTLVRHILSPLGHARLGHRRCRGNLSRSCRAAVRRSRAGSALRSDRGRHSERPERNV